MGSFRLVGCKTVEVVRAILSKSPIALSRQQNEGLSANQDLPSTRPKCTMSSGYYLKRKYDVTYRNYGGEPIDRVQLANVKLIEVL